MDRDSALVRSVSVRDSNYDLIILIGPLLPCQFTDQRSTMDRPASSFFLDQFRADQVLHHAHKKAPRFCSIPFAIFRFGFGYRIRDFGIQREGLHALCRSHLPVVLVVGGAFLAFQYFISGGGAAFRREHFTTFQLLLGLPLCFIWLSIEAGLVEEFFFRALVQSQLAARSNPR